MNEEKIYAIKKASVSMPVKNKRSVHVNQVLKNDSRRYNKAHSCTEKKFRKCQDACYINSAIKLMLRNCAIRPKLRKYPRVTLNITLAFWK